MGSGWAYFVEHDRYIEHVSQSADHTEVRELPTGIQKTDICLRSLAAAPIFMRLTKQTEDRPKTMSHLVSSLACVHVTLS